ncbi:MAG TPA: GAF domain-containing sensor histidine kinase [Herpetosiphonaceae bacterium]
MTAADPAADPAAGPPDARLPLLAEALAALRGSDATQTSLSRLLELARLSIGADAYAVWRQDSAGERWRIVAGGGLSNAYLRSLIDPPPIRAPADGGVLAYGDALAAGELRSRHEDFRREGIAAVLIIPADDQSAPGETITFYYRQRRHFNQQDALLARGLGALVAHAIATAAAHAEQQRLRERAEQAAQRARFLAEASAIFSSSLDERTILRRVGGLAVPVIADWSGVYLLGDDGVIEALAVAHGDPQKIALADELFERYPPNPQTARGLRQVVDSSAPLLIPAVSKQFLRQVAQDDDHLRLLEAVGLGSYMIVPLIARERRFGVLTLAIGAGRVPAAYDAEDLAFAEDLARRAALAAENARLYEAAQAALAARNQFISIAAHELKTPMTALMGNAQLLERRLAAGALVGEPELRVIGMITQQTRRLSRLSGSLMDLARLQRGIFAIEYGGLDLAALLRRTVGELAAGYEQLRLNLLAPPALELEGDELRLEEVFYNLVQNAAKYSPHGGEVAVSAESDGETAMVCVRDEGIGIPAEAQATLFAPFYRAANAAGRNIAGMGLGLYVVKEIITLHGGEISLESAEGRGSAFTVRLPLRRPRPPADAAADKS